MYIRAMERKKAKILSVKSAGNAKRPIELFQEILYIIYISIIY